MSRQSRNGCGWECCPSGLIEHTRHYRYLRRVTEEPYRITFREYWWHEFKSLIGLNRLAKKPTKDCEYCLEGGCYEHNFFTPEWLEELPRNDKRQEGKESK